MRDERGAVLPLVALLLVTIVAICAFAVDLGTQRVARRDMQALADAVALDLARLVDGRTADEIAAGSPTVRPLVQVRDASVARNAGTTVGDAPAVEVVLVDLDATGEPVLDAGGDPVAVTGTGRPDGVWVSAGTAVDFAFAPGRGPTSRTAVGVAGSSACLRLGSYAAALDSETSPVLTALLDDALGVRLIGYEGLADARVGLGALAAELGAGTVSELAALGELSIADLAAASARVLTADGGQGAAVAFLGTLATSVDPTLRVDLESVVDLSSGDGAVLEAPISVLDLVAGSAMVANGQRLADVPLLLSAPPYAAGALSLQVIESPRLACGRVAQARASTAQVRVAASTRLTPPRVAGLDVDPVTVGVTGELAGAEAVLTSITCGLGTLADPAAIGARVTTRLSSLGLEARLRLVGDIEVSRIVLDNSLLAGLFSPLAPLLPTTTGRLELTLDLGASLAHPPRSTDAVYAVPPRDYTDAEPVGGTGGFVLPTPTIDASDVSGTFRVTTLLGTRTLDLASLALDTQYRLTPVLDGLESQGVLPGLRTLVDEVNARLQPLTELLGLQLAGADLLGVAPPTCNRPALRG